MGSKVKTSESPCNEVHITSLLKQKQYISIYILGNWVFIFEKL